MATLQGRAIKDTYKDLLQVSNSNAGVDATVRAVEDGEGTTSALQLSTGTVHVDGTLEVKDAPEITQFSNQNSHSSLRFGAARAMPDGGINNVVFSTANTGKAAFQFNQNDTNTDQQIASFNSTGIASTIQVNNTGTLANDGALQCTLQFNSADSTYLAGQTCNIDLQTPYKRVNIGMLHKGQSGVYVQNVDDRNTNAMGFYPAYDAGMTEPTDATKTIVGMELGTSGLKWKQLFAATATIATSDENTKTQIESLSEAEKNVAVALKGLVKKFKFKSAVVAKGENARIHIGLIAQEVEAAFSAEGLNARDYSLFCEEKWYECTDSEGKVQNSPQELPNHDCVLKTQLGIRYEEVFAFIISTL